MRTGTQFDRLCLVLVNTRNPLNIGAAARAMSNFGFEHLRVVHPYEPAFREARSAVGAAPLLARAQECKSIAEAVADCSLVVGTTALNRRNPEQKVRDLEASARLIRKRLVTGRVALLFGSEKRGLSNEDLSYCDWLLRIATRKHRSMNLGQAVAVCLYELARRPQKFAREEQERFAMAGDLERLTAMLLDTLHRTDYLKLTSESAARPHAAAPAEEKIRRLVRRMKLSARDAELLLGMLRQILWKVETKSGTTQ